MSSLLPHGTTEGPGNGFDEVGEYGALFGADVDRGCHTGFGTFARDFGIGLGFEPNFYAVIDHGVAVLALLD